MRLAKPVGGMVAVAVALVAITGCRTAGEKQEFQQAMELREQAGTIVLKAANAMAHGNEIKYEVGDGKDNIGWWNDVADYVTWQVDVPRAGTYEVEVTFACDAGQGGSTYTVGVGNAQVGGTVADTGDWAAFETVILGTIDIARAGTQTLTVKSLTKPAHAVMNLQAVVLRMK